MRHVLACLAFLGLATACGGGGSGSSGTPATPPPAPPTPQQETQTAFEACGASDVSQAWQSMVLILQLLDGQGNPPNLTVADTSNAGNAEFSWTLDLDNDGNADANLTSTMLNGMDQPTVPGGDANQFAQFMNTTPQNLAAFLQSDNYTGSMRTVVNFAPANGASITGTISIALNAGVPTSSSTMGNLSTTNGGCTGTVSWAAVPASIPATSPAASGTVTFSVTDGTNTVAGTVTHNGNTTSDLSMSLNGGTAFNYGYDLNTGTVS